MRDPRRVSTDARCTLACTAFEQSQEADPAIGTQLNIALCYETWGHFASAYRAYLEAEKLAKAKSDERAIHAHKKLDELQPKIPHLRIDVLEGAEPSAVFLLDGKEIDRKQFVGATQEQSIKRERTLIENANLVGLLTSLNSHQRERVSDALTAGPPQPATR